MHLFTRILNNFSNTTQKQKKIERKKILPSSSAANDSRNITAQSKHPVDITTINILSRGNSKFFPVTR